jgi:leucyl aminopeptidase
VTLRVEVAEPGDAPTTGMLGLFATAPGDDSVPLLLSGPGVTEIEPGLPERLDADECTRDGFTAKLGQVLRLAAPSGRRVHVAGLGEAKRLGSESYRRAVAALVRSAGHGGQATVIVPREAPGDALAEGAVLAAYRFDRYRSQPPPEALERLVLVPATESGTDELRRAVERGLARADAVTFARDLVNTPPSDLDPSEFAEKTTERLAGRARTTFEVWDAARIESERLGGLLAVARGSSQKPRVVIGRYEPEPEAGGSVRHVVLVGKGITFDSGGLSLKTPEGMTTMKTDMSGAATVIAALSALSELSTRVRVTAIAMVTENMPGPSALKPGDVLRARNGKTIEVLNTDAEGRLVLSDGLSLAAELEPDAIIDVATLTGAQVVALGRSIGAIFATDDGLIEQLMAAGQVAGESLWPLPLPEDYAEHIDSEIADMKNTGRTGEAGSIAAAMLLSRFVGDVPWAHLDIAGPARAAEASGYLTKGGTGFGVRTLLGLLESLGTAPPPESAGERLRRELTGD